MTNLDRLIKELCPDGVEFVYLWTVTIWDKRFNAVEREKQPKVINYPYLLAADLFQLVKEGGDVFLLSTGERTGWTTEEMAGEYLREGEVVTIPWGKSRPVKDVIKYYKGRFVTADNRIATSNDTDKLLNKFLYYWMMNQGAVMDTFYRGSGIKHPSMAAVLDMQIPLPPLPIQREVVRILDNFTELTAELTSELTARKKQYEYYRNEMLTFGDDVPVVKLGEVSTLITKGTTPKAFAENGVNFVKLESFDNSKINPAKFVYVSKDTHSKELKRSILKANDILFAIAGATIGKCAMVEEELLPANTNQALAIVRLSERINARFAFYYLHTAAMTEYISKYNKTSAQPNLNLQQISDFSIPLPPLEEQARIVSILDKFDALTTDIAVGLPAEIEARTKQYEYYRNKLLTFEEAMT